MSGLSERLVCTSSGLPNPIGCPWQRRYCSDSEAGFKAGTSHDVLVCPISILFTEVSLQEVGCTTTRPAGHSNLPRSHRFVFRQELLQDQFSVSSVGKPLKVFEAYLRSAQLEFDVH